MVVVSEVDYNGFSIKNEIQNYWEALNDCSTNTNCKLTLCLFFRKLRRVDFFFLRNGSSIESIEPIMKFLAAEFKFDPGFLVIGEYLSQIESILSVNSDLSSASDSTF